MSSRWGRGRETSGPMDRLSVLCFAGTYGLALASDLPDQLRRGPQVLRALVKSEIATPDLERTCAAIAASTPPLAKGRTPCSAGLEKGKRRPELTSAVVLPAPGGPMMMYQGRLSR